MAEIGFYHLTRSEADRALAKLLGRTLDAAARAIVLAPDATRLASLDEALWRQTEIDFLPHGTTEAALQPVLLTDDDAMTDGAPNGASFLFLVGGADSAHLARYDRIFDLFDGRDAAAVAAARARWLRARAAGHALTYWKEGARGWERGP